MHHLIPKVLEYFPYWNQIVHREETHGQIFLQTRGILKIETDLIEDLGEYRVRSGKPVILLHKFLTRQYRPWVFFHECGHDMFHSPLSCTFSTDMRKKIETEANIVAAVALIPVEVLRTKHAWEIQEEYGYPLKLILFRKYIYDTYDKF